MAARFEQLNEGERKWLDANIKVAEILVATHSPSDSGTPLNAASLDRAFGAWLKTNESDTEQVNAIVNAVGIAFGSLLVEKAGFNWVVASDEGGTEMAVLALPGKGDVLVYPANFVAKRWERKETNFLEAALADMVKQVNELAAGLPAHSSTEKTSLWSRFFKGN